MVLTYTGAVPTDDGAGLYPFQVFNVGPGKTSVCVGGVDALCGEVGQVLVECVPAISNRFIFNFLKKKKKSKKTTTCTQTNLLVTEAEQCSNV